MIAELGLAALWLAATLSLLQLVCGALATRAQPSDSDLALITRPAAALQGGLAAVAFAMLIWVFAITDLSVTLVAANSHAMKPLVFKIAGLIFSQVPFLGQLLIWIFSFAHLLIAIVWFVAYITTIVKALLNKEWEVPYLGWIVRKQLGLST